MSDPVATPPVVPPLLADYVPRLFTVADLAELPSELPSGPVLYELHHGRLITMPPPGDIHGAVQTKITSALYVQGELKGVGKARSVDVGIVLAQNPDHVFGADAVFITNASLPIRRSPQGYLLTIPELVAEIRSKNDTRAALERKGADYLAAGTKVYWMLDPIQRTVTEYRPGAEPRTYTEDDTLTVEDVIPGFSLSVRLALQE
jgi:Uma2 family endonuclease